MENVFLFVFAPCCVSGCIGNSLNVGQMTRGKSVIDTMGLLWEV